MEDADWPGVIAAVKTYCDVRPSGCWEWQRALDSKGYPTVSLKRRDVLLHRLVLEAKYSGRPLGKQAAHHICANTFCVNPDHLQPVTARENIAEMLARRYMEQRIVALERALTVLTPDHPLLSEIGVVTPRTA